MKKLWIIPLLALLLAGCGGKPVRETVSDVPVVPVISVARRILIQLPAELSAPTLQSEETGALYICDDYSVTIHTVEAGDLNRTIRETTGMERETLQIIETQQDGVKKYQWVWAVGGENGAQVGRGCILDDGAYHYILTAIADEGTIGRVQESWQTIFRSFRLAEEREQISTGS